MRTGLISYLSTAYNFFEPQPIKGAAVYFLRYIIHDWPDDSARKILKQARLAAASHSKLIVVEKVISYALLNSSCTSPIPYPLLGNLGAVNFPIMGMDLQVCGNITRLPRLFKQLNFTQMMTLFNGQERTLSHIVRLANSTGWELDSVSRSQHNALSLLVFKPVSMVGVRPCADCSL